MRLCKKKKAVEKLISYQTDRGSDWITWSTGIKGWMIEVIDLGNWDEDRQGWWVR